MLHPPNGYGVNSSSPGESAVKMSASIVINGRVHAIASCFHVNLVYGVPPRVLESLLWTFMIDSRIRLESAMSHSRLSCLLPKTYHGRLISSLPPPPSTDVADQV